MNTGATVKTRRDVLATGAGVAGLATMTPAAIGARPSAAEGRAGIRVRNGESRIGPPLTIEGNPFVTSKVSPDDTRGGYLLVALDTPPGVGPELHIHTGQSEWFYVVDGRIGLECDGVRIVLEKGDSYLVPVGAAHAYVVLGDSTAHLLNLFDPGGSMLAFFGAYSAILNTPGPPDAIALKRLYEAHGMRVVGPPLDIAAFT